MNDHAVSGGGYLFEFRGKRPLRGTARWVTGAGLAVAGVAVAAIGTASHSFLSMPLGIAVAVLGAILLVLHAATRSQSKPGSAPARTRRHRIQNLHQENVKESVASELALLAELHAQGALTPEEFVAAKRRVLGI
ncbi:SHOCT domain-containing protein [Pseudarthrobacter siccitolerans]|uniref:SHOCT domain-containing protein n=1 Tax=Pseudarthrobacter siccitolerans TaxID=861266 RepID=UPI00359017CF